MGKTSARAAQWALYGSIQESILCPLFHATPATKASFEYKAAYVKTEMSASSSGSSPEVVEEEGPPASSTSLESESTYKSKMDHSCIP